MKRPWIWALLFGLLVGTTAGLGSSFWVFAAPSAEASAFLLNFSFQEVGEKAEYSKWEILEDKIKIYPGIPALGRPQRIERRMVARATLSETELVAFARQFDSVVHDVLRSKQAEIMGASIRLQSQVPYYRWTRYQIADTPGVIETWLNRQAGQATAIVRLTESCGGHLTKR